MYCHLRFVEEETEAQRGKVAQLIHGRRVSTMKFNYAGLFLRAFSVSYIHITWKFISSAMFLCNQYKGNELT